MRSRLTLIVMLFCGSLQPQPAMSQDQYLDQALKYVHQYFESVSPVDLAKAQAVLSLSGHYRLSTDGKWGPGTKIAFEQMLKTYTAIGGSGPDWGVNSRQDTARFLNWMDTAANAYLTGSEFPD